MDPLVEVSVSVQKYLAKFGGVSVGVFTGGLFAAQLVVGTVWVPSWGLALLAALSCLREVRFLARRGKQTTVPNEFGLFLSLTSLVYLLLSFGPGGAKGTLHPVVYVTLVIVSAYGRGLVLLSAVTLAAVLEGALWHAESARPELLELVLQIAFLVLITGLHALLYRGELERMRAVSREQLEGEKNKMKRRARAYRLESAQTTAPPEVVMDSGVQEVHEALRFSLSLLVDSLSLRTAAVYLKEDGKNLVLHEAVSKLELRETPLPIKEGIWGAALGRLEPVVVSGSRASHHASFYAEATSAETIAAIPLLSGGKAAGVLLCDRAIERPLSEDDVRIVARAGEFILRAIENERVFSDLSRAATEQAKLYRAAGALATAKSEAEVIEVSVESAREVASFDYAAVTLFHKKTGVHEICAVSGEGEGGLVGRQFRHNAGLVAMVVANRHALPFRGEYEPSRQTVFARGLEPPKMPSLLVLPLIVHERVLGTLVLGSHEKGAFHDRVRPALEVLASHMAVSLANARMLRRLEEQATTDGMTGLLNKRTLISEAEKRIKAAARFKKPLSVLVTDIDHFKRVNDTYGHDVGDVVIKGLGEVLKRIKRDTDLVGRFGGEEFVAVCEHTDEEGAKNLAERIRKELETTTFQTELGPLSVTCSVGVATFPAAGQDWESLFKATDEALYVSKRGGRNQVTVWTPRLQKTSAA